MIKPVNRSRLKPGNKCPHCDRIFTFEQCQISMCMHPVKWEGTSDPTKMEGGPPRRVRVCNRHKKLLKT